MPEICGVFFAFGLLLVFFGLKEGVLIVLLGVSISALSVCLLAWILMHD